MTDLEDAAELTKEMEFRTPLQGLPSFDAIIGHKDGMTVALKRAFGVSVQSDRPAKEYSIIGRPDQPNEGRIDVKVFATNDPDVFLGQYRDSDGDVDWVIRPLENDDAEE